MLLHAVASVAAIVDGVWNLILSYQCSLTYCDAAADVAGDVVIAPLIPTSLFSKSGNMILRTAVPAVAPILSMLTAAADSDESRSLLFLQSR